MKAYKFRLYPNKEQKILLDKNFGCVRFVYNKILFLVEKTKELGWCKIKTQNGTTVNKKGKTVGFVPGFHMVERGTEEFEEEYEEIVRKMLDTMVKKANK